MRMVPSHNQSSCTRQRLAGRQGLLQRIRALARPLDRSAAER